MIKAKKTIKKNRIKATEEFPSITICFRYKKTSKQCFDDATQTAEELITTKLKNDKRIKEYRKKGYEYVREAMYTTRRKGSILYLYMSLIFLKKQDKTLGLECHLINDILK